MSDFIPKAPAGVAKGLGPKAQKLAALRAKAEQAKGGEKDFSAASGGGVKAASGFKKTNFQRKAT